MATNESTDVLIVSSSQKPPADFFPRADDFKEPGADYVHDWESEIEKAQSKPLEVITGFAE